MILDSRKIYEMKTKKVVVKSYTRHNQTSFFSARNLPTLAHTHTSCVCLCNNFDHSRIDVGLDDNKWLKEERRKKKTPTIKFRCASAHEWNETKAKNRLHSSSSFDWARTQHNQSTKSTNLQNNINFRKRRFIDEFEERKKERKIHSANFEPKNVWSRSVAARASKFHLKND